MSAPQTVEGNLIAQAHSYALCVSRFNDFITERLLEGAVDALVRHGVLATDLCIYRCAGAWELGGLSARVLHAGRVDGLIALGCLIKGSTDHYGLIAGQVTSALGKLSLEGAQAQRPVAVTFGVLTTDSIEQAVERAGTKAGNKGAEAALACIEQVNLLRAIALG